MTQALDQNLLINRISVEQQNHRHQIKDHVANFEVEQSPSALARRRETYGDDCSRQHHDHENGIAPGPPIAPVNSFKLARQFLTCDIRRRWEMGNLTVNHDVRILERLRESSLPT